MALFSRKSEAVPDHDGVQNDPQAGTPDWRAPAQERKGTRPRGLHLNRLEFGSTGTDGSAPALERIGLKELLEADALDNADLKANHVEPGVLTGMLADAMNEIETKFNNGIYDAAAMPLVEEYLAEMRKMALIQADRNAIIAERISDAKEANRLAHTAVFEAREERSAAILRRYDETQEHWAHEQRNRQARKDAKRERRLRNKQMRIHVKDAAREQKQQNELRKMASEYELANLEATQRIRRAAQEEAENERRAVQRALDERNARLEQELHLEERRRESNEAAKLIEQRIEEEYARLKEFRNDFMRDIDDVANRARRTDPAQHKPYTVSTPTAAPFTADAPATLDQTPEPDKQTASAHDETSNSVAFQESSSPAYGPAYMPTDAEPMTSMPDAQMPNTPSDKQSAETGAEYQSLMDRIRSFWKPKDADTDTQPDGKQQETDTKLCKQCGGRLVEGAAFCPWCEAPVEEDPDASTTSAVAIDHDGEEPAAETQSTEEAETASADSPAENPNEEDAPTSAAPKITGWASATNAANETDDDDDAASADEYEAAVDETT